MASFAINENFPIGVVQFLREMGDAVLTSHEAGNAINEFQVKMF